MSLARSEVYQNINGQVFFVGDIHGCYTSLLRALDRVGFDYGRDQLICTGDLIDRGPESFKTLELLNQRWFHTVLGNHEQIALQAMEYIDAGDADKLEKYADYWESCGGRWFFQLEKPQMLEMMTSLRDKLESLPLALTVNLVSGERVGVVHASPLAGRWELSTKKLDGIERQHVLWSRERVTRDVSTQIKNIDAVCVGHTVINSGSPLVKGNVVHIDQGSWKNGEAFELFTGSEIVRMTQENKKNNFTQSLENQHEQFKRAVL